MENNKEDWDSLEGESGERAKFIPEGVRKVVALGVGAAFLTEETIRSLLGDIKLPKEVLGKLLESAHRSKEDLIARVGDELVSIVKKIDVVKEASRFVEDHKFRISAEIEVLKKPANSETTATSSDPTL